MFKLKQKQKTDETGLGLVETLAAVSVAIIVITALVSLSVFTLRASTRGKLLLQGSKLANNQLELVRAYRDSRDTWDEFISTVINCQGPNNNPQTYCHIAVSNDLSVNNGFSVIDSGTPTETSVGFYVTNPDTGGAIDSSATVVRINVRVSWQVGSETHNSYIYTDVTDWRFR